MCILIIYIYSPLTFNFLIRGKCEEISHSPDLRQGMLYLNLPPVAKKTYHIQDDSFEASPCEFIHLVISKIKAGLLLHFQRWLEIEIEVIGLMIGARGTIPLRLQEFCSRFNLPKSLIEDIAVATVKYSVQVLHHHFKPPITPSPQT